MCTIFIYMTCFCHFFLAVQTAIYVVIFIAGRVLVNSFCFIFRSLTTIYFALIFLQTCFASTFNCRLSLCELNLFSLTFLVSFWAHLFAQFCRYKLCCSFQIFAIQRVVDRYFLYLFCLHRFFDQVVFFVRGTRF